jgi:hypothetical protein
LAAVIDQWDLVEDHPKTWHEQYPEARNKESENESGEGTVDVDCTSAGWRSTCVRVRWGWPTWASGILTLWGAGCSIKTPSTIS